ncbi:hypothetical protein NG798_25215 [Ancylothrix sp. C2]|uniref:hypothetical protein n=1 Tax=Ancylothrix sp. D3o TaxID=2953691 RepID=UPI0021BA68DB|nr:hypothetical protein [Ancylothrix sp. D3o]MCT7953102.1 hypothetical protein [Ancylothrix sp. D3o]
MDLCSLGADLEEPVLVVGRWMLDGRWIFWGRWMFGGRCHARPCFFSWDFTSRLRQITAPAPQANIGQSHIPPAQTKT